MTSEKIEDKNVSVRGLFYDAAQFAAQEAITAAGGKPVGYFGRDVGVILDFDFDVDHRSFYEAWLYCYLCITIVETGEQIKVESGRIEHDPTKDDGGIARRNGVVRAIAKTP